ncbi:site-specific integrase [Sphingopyxis sp. YR583]|uniref:site-specific integrase n=1 Tax=Sphingopyxis sp. YR583 TaxID=1881047 RepID=UPI0015A64404|nr:site-specific integrase [Sphingopyxis sp. YR583]
MTAEKIDEMSAELKERRPTIRRRAGSSAKKAQLSKEEAALLNIAQTDHADNPFAALTANRNGLIILMLNELGLRAGELLAIKVPDIDFQAQEIVIERRHHDHEDPRQYQPVVKTLDRRLPLSDELASRLSCYVLSDRRQFHRARHHPMLFVSTRGSRSGRAGDPISRQALTKVTSALSAKLPRGCQHVHPHIFRHNAATRFYRQLREQDIPEERIERLLEAKFGWAEGSGSARAYIESEVQAEALKAQKEAQNAWRMNSHEP